LLALRGAGCARGVPASEVLRVCGIDDPLATLPPDEPLAGREAVRMLEQVAEKL
jgi:hypothetical protein